MGRKFPSDLTLVSSEMAKKMSHTLSQRGLAWRASSWRFTRRGWNTWVEGKG